METVTLTLFLAQEDTGAAGIVGFVIALVISGAVVGGLGRLALPGPDPMSIPQTIGVGIAGSFLAGLVVALLTGGEAVAGIFASVLGAVFVVWLVRRSREKRAGGPGGGAPRTDLSGSR